MKGNLKDIISDFLKDLRYNEKRLKVKEIMKATGLSRMTLLDLEKKRRVSISDNVLESFKNAYGEDFLKFQESYISKTDNKKIAVSIEDFEELKSIIIEITKELLSLQKENRKLKEINSDLKKKVNESNF